MEKSKLLLLVKSLNKKEFARLESYVKSPFLNKSNEAIKIYMELKKVFPKLEGYKVSKKYFAKKLYGSDSKESQEKLSYPMFHLTKCLENYLIWLELEQQKDDIDMLTLKAYERRQLDKFYFKKIEALNKEKQKHKEIDLVFYLQQYRLNSMLYRHPSNKKLSISNESLLLEKNQSLDIFYVYAKLQEVLININRKKIINEKNELFLVEDLVKNIENTPYLHQHPIIAIYLFFIKYLPKEKGFNKDDYLKTKSLIFDNFPKLSLEEFSNIFILFMQYVSQLKYNTEVDLVNEQLELYEFGIKNKVLFEKDGKVLPFAIYNAVQVACELDKQEWAKQFISEQLPNIHEKHQENIRLISHAYISCSLGEYDKTLEYLREVNAQKHFYYDLVIKTLTIRCFYLSDDSDLLHNYVDTFYAFIRRHTVMSPIIKEQFLNYARIVILLDKSRYTSKINKEEILKKINQEENVYFRSWLLKQASFLPKRV